MTSAPVPPHGWRSAGTAGMSSSMRTLRSLLRRVARRTRRVAEATGVRAAHLAGAARGRVADPHQQLANAVWDRRYSKTDDAGQLEHADCDPLDYTRHPFIYRHAISEPLTGDGDRFWLDAICDRYLRPAAGTVLSLGCGTAIHEEHLLSRGFAERVIAYDMSAEGIAAARRRLDATAFGSRIELRCGDPLADGLPTAGFDVLLVEAAIHHFVRIDEMFELMHRVLKPSGVLVYDEYVGGDHHQHPPELIALLDRVNACLAPAYRRDFESGAPREHVAAAPLEWMLAYDPTEGVHASRILPLTYQYFEVIERRDYGGAILRPFFSRILTNWDFTDPKDQTIARLIILLEQELTRVGAIPTHQTLVVARPRPHVLRPLSDAATARIGYVGWTPPV
jgi:ubiquinone/menaquinone biosynthesis C-methylase UbiE